MEAFIIAVLILVSFVVFFWLTEKHQEVKRQRIILYDALLKAHRRAHNCQGGLGVSLETGEVVHFGNEREGKYDFN